MSLHPHEPWIEWERISPPIWEIVSIPEFLFILAAAATIVSFFVWAIDKASE